MSHSITFEPSTDPEAIFRILSHPQCWHRMVPDGMPPFTLGVIRLQPGTECVLARQNQRTLGLFLLIDRGHGKAEVHFCLLPEVWGESVELGKSFVAWVWENRPFTALLGPVPSYNRLALRFARRVGMEEAGTLPAEGTHNQQPFHHVLMLLPKP